MSGGCGGRGGGGRGCGGPGLRAVTHSFVGHWFGRWRVPRAGRRR
ncbi:hypothetical protein APASM_1266 [Actinosynnema pretiosum subsp. pretiosum]|nr:hypothetical protein APASM_1266 [Actinosynnema pretiosum subsp. pretiosum]